MSNPMTPQELTKELTAWVDRNRGLTSSNVLIELAVDQKCVKIASIKVNDKATYEEMNNAANNALFMLMDLSHKLKEQEFPVAPLSSQVETEPTVAKKKKNKSAREGIFGE
jgi:hypothetical protein